MAHSSTRDLSEHLPLVIYCESTMILAWVLSLLTLFSMLVIQLERLAVLEAMSVNTYVETQKRFIAAEKALLQCEQHLSNITVLANPACHMQSVGKNLWLLSSESKPSLEILIFLDEKTNIATRLNWRQNFE
jgi:Tfp pilus assembly protein PilX